MPEGELRLRSHHMTWRRLGDSVIVLDLNNSTYLSLNGTGVVIWEQLVRGTTISAIVRSVTDQFDVEPAVAELDINLFVEDIRSRGFLL
jgi:Coenzyme PQQ synthesis protein D (PqqD)